MSGNPPTDDVVTGPYPTVIYPNDDRRSGEKVLLVQDATFGKYLGYLQVTFDDEGRVTEYRGNPIVLDANVEQGMAQSDDKKIEYDMKLTIKQVELVLV